MVDVASFRLYNLCEVYSETVLAGNSRARRCAASSESRSIFRSGKYTIQLGVECGKIRIAFLGSTGYLGTRIVSRFAANPANEIVCVHRVNSNLNELKMIKGNFQYISIGTGLPDNFNIYTFSKSQLNEMGRFFADRKKLHYVNLVMQNDYGPFGKRDLLKFIISYLSAMKWPLKVQHEAAVFRGTKAGTGNMQKTEPSAGISNSQ